VEDDPYEPLGLRAGSFILRPAIEFTGGYDSNPPRSSTPEGSALYVVAPELRVRSDWDLHEFRANVHGSYTGYNSLPSLNRPYFESVLDGRIDLTSQTRIDLQHRFLVATDSPGSPNFEADADELTIFTDISGSAGIAHRFNRVEVGAKVAVDRRRYEDSELSDGSVASNADRDYSTYRLELRGSYELTPGIKPFIAIETDSRVYDLTADSFGVQRDSKGFAPRIGSSFELSRLLTGHVSLGYLTRTYDDPDLQDLRGWIADSSLVWLATGLTKVTFTAKSWVFESTDPDISGVLAHDIGIQVEHSFRDWLLGTIKFGFGVDDYVGSSRVDHRLFGSAVLTYKLNRNAQIKGELRQEQRSSNVSDQDYTASIFLLGLRLQL
jgi:hypothetical protein